jgi:uncharacterized protein YgiM (DUF1202 family)
LQPNLARTRRRRALGLAAALLLFIGVPAIAQEEAWVKGEVRVNLRTGAGREFRITRELETGDRVEIVARGDGWTQVKPEKGEPGWIPAGYLATTPPAQVLLDEIAAERDRLAARVEELSEAGSDLRAETEAIRGRDADQAAEIERLTHENIRLRAGVRWPERLTGAGIVLFGMIVGAVVARRSGRQRNSPRIKL